MASPETLRRGFFGVAGLGAVGVLVQADGDQFGDAGLFHGDAVETVGEFHGALVVRDENELRVLGHLANQIVEAIDVRVVEWGIDFVEQTERAGPNEEHGEDHCHGGERFFAAGEERHALQLLAGGLRHDFDPRFEQVGFVGEDELRLAAAEELGEELLEALVDRVERVAEAFAADAIDFDNRLAQGLD